MSNFPCKNPNCKSQGRLHPNCRCYDAMGGEEYAKGGKVHFCSSKIRHLQECEYFADGGEIQPQVTPPTDPATTIGHAAVEHGLLGLLKDVGQTNMTDPDKHTKTFDKAKAHLTENNHEKATETLHGHPLSGSVSKNNLGHIMQQLGPAIMASDANHEALRGSIDYMNSAIKGHNSLDSHMGNLLGPNKLSVGSRSIDGLKKYLAESQEKPEQMLDVGGSLGHYLPAHASALGATAATATEYLNSLKPTEAQLGPIDEPVPADKNETAKWDRQLSIAQHPLEVLGFAKSGTLLPQDIITIQTIYPALYKSMAEKASEALIEAKTKKVEIPYRQRQGLSILLGTPVDATQTPAAARAIIQSAGPQQIQNQQNKMKGPKKATGVELKQINKVDSLSETPLEARQINRNRN